MCVDRKRQREKQSTRSSEVRYVESAVNYAGPQFTYSYPCLWCPLSTALVEFGCIIVCSLLPPPFAQSL